MSDRTDGAALIPPELARGGPRRVVLTGSGRVLATLSLALALGAAFAFVGLYAAADEQRARSEAFAAEGARTEAVITDVRRGDGENGRRRMSYRYEVNGRAVAGTVRLRPGPGRGVGDRLAIVYLPSAPDVHYVEARGLRGVPFWLVPLLPLGMLAGAALIVRTLQNQRRLVESGRPAVAVVTGARKVRHQHGSHFAVSYEFRLMNGSSRAGSYQVQKQPPEAGTPVVVVYDRDRPEHNKRYPTALVRAATDPVR